MYEEITYESLIERMLETALKHDPNLDSREGSVLWYGQAPAAVEIQNLYIQLDTILRETFGDTASRYYLIKRAAERGIVPYPATKAVWRAKAEPEGCELPDGARFSLEELNFIITAKTQDGFYELECETPGSAGNNGVGELIPIEYQPGLHGLRLCELLIPGEDEEDTEALRARYIASFNALAYGGNVTDYQEKVNAIPGVGGVRVYRAWNGKLRPAELVPPDGLESWLQETEMPSGVRDWLQKAAFAARRGLLTVGGTVRLVIIDAAFKTPSDTLLQTIQTAIDPVRNHGEGDGLAPIGHVVTVEGVQSVKVDIQSRLTLTGDWTWDEVRPHAEKAVDDYFKELSGSWAGQNAPLTVRISQIETRLLACAGVTDVMDTTLNGRAENLTLGKDEIPVRGELVG